MKKILAILSITLYILSSCTSSTPACDVPAEISYTNGISSIIKENCFTCHSPENYKKKGGYIKLYDEKSLKKLAKEGTLMGAVNHERGYIAMPYKKGIKLDSCVRVVLQTWVEEGCK